MKKDSKTTKTDKGYTRVPTRLIFTLSDTALRILGYAVFRQGLVTSRKIDKWDLSPSDIHKQFSNLEGYCMKRIRAGIRELSGLNIIRREGNYYILNPMELSKWETQEPALIGHTHDDRACPNRADQPAPIGHTGTAPIGQTGGALIGQPRDYSIKTRFKEYTKKDRDSLTSETPAVTPAVTKETPSISVAKPSPVLALEEKTQAFQALAFQTCPPAVGCVTHPTMDTVTTPDGKEANTLSVCGARPGDASETKPDTLLARFARSPVGDIDPEVMELLDEVEADLIASAKRNGVEYTPDGESVKREARIRCNQRHTLNATKRSRYNR